MRAKPCGGKEFQSTLPVRGATEAADAEEVVSLFQSTLPVRGATMVYVW